MSEMLDLARSIVGPAIGNRIFEVRAIVQIAVTTGINEGPTVRYTGAGPSKEDAIRAACKKMLAAEAPQA